MPVLDAYAKPPDKVYAVYKQYQKIPKREIGNDPHIIDLTKLSNGIGTDQFHFVRTIDASVISFYQSPSVQDVSSSPAQVYESCRIPGLHVIPSFIPGNLQLELLSRLLHRDLANPMHQTNLHKHYNMPYQSRDSSTEEATGDNSIFIRSFFKSNPTEAKTFKPLDPQVHKPLTLARVLNKKLRWITLGGQYDWTRKVYPDEEPPEFPEDIGCLIHNAFPDMRPEAAIVNVYSPGDVLSLHRDVSEDCDEGLVSISIGCDAIFVVGISDESGNDDNTIAIRLRSGDAMYMSGSARYAWHGVPSIIAGTCPEYIASWPANCADERNTNDISSDRFEAWKGWIGGKRINLNVRQMKP